MSRIERVERTETVFGDDRVLTKLNRCCTQDINYD
jgi:hypothetical protein